MSEVTTIDLVRYLAELDEQLNDTLDLSDQSMGLEDKARLLAQVDAVIGTMTAFRAELGALVFADMPDDLLVVQGLPPLVRSTGGRRKKWRGGALSQKVTDKVLESVKDDVPPMAVLAERVRAALVACGGLDNGSHDWRKGECAKLEININKFCDYEQGNKTEVKFVK